MTQILVVPDLFYHRWDQRRGELWLALRSFLHAPGASDADPNGDLTNFNAWVQTPHEQSKFSYADRLSKAAQACRVGEGERLIPILLPSDLDVWVQVIRGEKDPAPWTRLARSQHCRTTPDLLEGDLGDFFRKDETPFFPKNPSLAPFAWWFNETIKLRHDKAQGAERLRLSQWLELRMESGNLIDWQVGKDILDLFVNDADPAKPPLPVFQADGPALETWPVGVEKASNLFWLGGQMLRLGVKPAKDFINQITGVHIHLAPSSLPPEAAEPTGAVFKTEIPPLVAGQPPQPPYFSKIDDVFDVRIISDIATPVAAAEGLASTPEVPAAGQKSKSAANEVVYVGPVFRGLSRADNVDRGFVFAAERMRPADETDGAAALKRPSPGQDALRSSLPPKLQDLAGFEIRANEAQGGNPQELWVQPGVVITGRLRPYRRFPRVMGPGARLETVLVFEPAEGAAPLLAELQKVLKPATFEALFKKARLDKAWSLELLSANPLPWDGPLPVYRVLATPSDAASVDDKTARTLDGASVTLALASAKGVATAKRARVDPEKAIDHWLWRPGDTVDAAGLPDFWKGVDDEWARAPINALFLDTHPLGSRPADFDITRQSGRVLPGDPALDCLFLGDFSFTLADSRLRLERNLVIGAQGGQATSAAACKVGDEQTPAQDYEDDLVNFNAAKLLDKDRKPLDGRVRFAQGRLEDSRVGNLYRRQSIPLVVAWPNDPTNADPADLDPTRKMASGRKAAVDVTTVTATWQDLQAFVRKAFYDPLPTEPFRVDLQHSYGPTLPASPDGKAPLELKRAARYGWPVDTPTAAEAFEKTPTVGQDPKQVRLLTCEYDEVAGDIVLTVDVDVLDPVVLEQKYKGLEERDRFTLALTAWRSLAELKEAASVKVAVELRKFDLNRLVGKTPAHAAQLARQGASGKWSEVVTSDTWTFELSTQARKHLVEWAKKMLKASALTAPSEPARVHVDLPNKVLGEEAHVARAHLLIDRASDRGAPTDVLLKPITMQLGRRQIGVSSLLSVWAQMGYGPWGAKPPADLDVLGGERLRQAKAHWLERLQSEADSITPKPPKPPKAPESAGPAAASGVSDEEPLRQAAALVAELEGTDWFVPNKRPKADGADIQPVLLPLGFAGCAPHPKLDRLSQPILQRALAMLRDTVDLAYEHWAHSGESWRERMGKISALATWTPPVETSKDVWTEGKWTGPAVELLETLVVRLLKPQPDASSPTVSAPVRALASALTSTSESQIKHVQQAVLRLLYSDPALFADAKALLLTQLLFVENKSIDESPPPETLARARFRRDIRPPASEPRAGRPSALPAQLTTIAGWETLVGAGISPDETPFKQRLAFLEPLDDAAYDNAFNVSTGDFTFEAFEEMVQPSTPDPDKPPPLPRLGWGRKPPVTPAAAAADQPTQEVRLASRNLATPPVYKWSGSSPELEAALRRLKVGDTGWWRDRLSHGEPPPQPPQGAHANDLSLVAKRPPEPQWDKPVSSDRKLVYFIYEVQGDEETSGADAADAFANDGFFVRAGRAQTIVAAGDAPPVFPDLSATMEKTLREALSHPRGSKAAAEYSGRVLLETAGVFPALGGLIQTYRAQQIPSDSVLLRPSRGVAGSAGTFYVGPKGPADIVHDVALLRPAAPSADNSAPADTSAYLVFGLALDVWTDWHVELFHGRNLPFYEWGADASDGAKAPARFAPEYWSSAQQSTAPVVHRLSGHAFNEPDLWGKPKRVLALPDDWIGAKIPIRTVVDGLLFSKEVRIGEDGPHAPTILDPANQSRVYDHRLMITVQQEQFEAGQKIPRSLRFALPTIACPNADAAAKTELFFPDIYATMSVDFHWFREGGSSPLFLQRIFVST